MNNRTGLDTSIEISDKAFHKFRDFIYEKAGIHMTDVKKPLISGRLRKRVIELGFSDYMDYYNYLTSEKGIIDGELQYCINKLTTNETYFFREPQHFDYLISNILPKFSTQKNIKIWSAASSSGEEAYSLAMILADNFGIGAPWQIWATDISTKVLESASKGIYSHQRTEHVPDNYRKKYLLKGIRSQKDYVCVNKQLRGKVRFSNYNLIESPLPVEYFDVIFCRNVLIYFDTETKTHVVNRLLQRLNNEGVFFSGRSESLHGMNKCLHPVFPSVYINRST